VTTLLSLHGFWRDFDTQVRTVLPAGAAVLCLVVLLALVVVGVARMLAERDRAASVLLTLGVLGLVLASGVAGPFESFYRFLFDHLPLFETMREQQKWLALTVVLYAVAAGWAVEWLAAVVPASARAAWASTLGGRVATRAPAVMCAAIALASAPALLGGLGGTISTSAYPAGWYAADAAMGGGDELALFLPWHGYQPFAFTDGRSVATPAEAFFRRPVLSSDAVEVGALRTDSTSQRTAYVDQLVAQGGGPAFARLLAPLGVRYVVLARGQEDATYAWVAGQPGLTKVLETDSVAVYRVEPSGTGRVVSRQVQPTVRSAQATAEAGRLGTEAVTASGVDEGLVPSTSSGGLHRTGPTSWALDAGPPGWVVVPEEFSPGWKVDGRSGQPTLAGTVALRAGGGPV
jgi:hypothetical protein